MRRGRRGGEGTGGRPRRLLSSRPATMLNGVARFRQPHLVLEKRSSRKRREEGGGRGRTRRRRRGVGCPSSRITRSGAPPRVSRMRSRNLGREPSNNSAEEEDAMTILLSCFSARELNTRTRNCPRRTTTYNRVDGDRSYCVTHSLGQDVNSSTTTTTTTRARV